MSEDGKNGPTHLGLVSSVGYVIFFFLRSENENSVERLKGFKCLLGALLESRGG